jgi:hypothetical protein
VLARFVPEGTHPTPWIIIHTNFYVQENQDRQLASKAVIMKAIIKNAEGG